MAIQYDTDLDLTSHSIHNLVDPVSAQDAATRHFVLNPGNVVNMGGNWISNLSDPSATTDAANKEYVDAKVLNPGGAVTLSSHQINNLADPAAAQDAATKNYVDTTTAYVSYGGYGGGDKDAFGDLLSQIPRYQANSVKSLALNSGGTLTVPSQNAFAMYCTRAFSSTGIRFATGSSSSTSGNTVTASLYTGVSQGALSLKATVSVPFTTTNTLVQVAWGSGQSIAVGWAVVVWTVTAATTAPKLAAITTAVGMGTFLNPAAGNYTSAYRNSTSTLPSTLDLTSGWTQDSIYPWQALY